MARVWTITALLALTGAGVALPDGAARPGGPPLALAQSAPGAAREGDRWRAEEQRLRAAIRLNPNVAAFHASLAESLRQQDRLPEAATSYQEAVRLDPDNVGYRIRFARSLAELRQWNWAEDELEQAIALDPTSGESYVALGDIRRARGDEEGAAAAHARARALQGEGVATGPLTEAGSETASPAPGRPAWAAALAALPRLLTLAAGLALAVAGIALALPILGALALLAVVAPISLLRAAAR